MNVEFVGHDKQGHLGETVCKWLDEHKNEPGSPYTIENIQPNVASIVDLKVGKDGSLTPVGEGGDGSSSSGGGAATNAAATPDNPALSGAFSAGAGAAGNSFGGVTGRRQNAEKASRPGGVLGGAGSGGGFSAGGAGDPNAAAAAGSKDPQFNRGSGAGAEGESKVELDKIAPIPSRPGTYPPNSTVHVGKVTFVVKFKEVIQSAAPAAAEGQ